MVERLEQQRFIYSPHAAPSSVTKRVAAPAFSFNLPAVNPANKVLCVRTRMTSPGLTCPELLPLAALPHFIFLSGVTARSRVSPRVCSLIHAGFYQQTQHRKPLITAETTRTHTHTEWNSSTSECFLKKRSMLMAYSVPANTDILLLKRYFVPQV